MGGAVLCAEIFGDLVTVVNLETIIDLQSWCRTWPPNGSSHIRAKQKLLRKTQKSLQKFLEPDRKPKVIYTDNSLEFGKACEDLSWNHCTSTPHRSETIGIAERVVRRVEEGTSAVWLQPGLNENWWADSMECHTYLRNIQDLLSDGKTPYERRFGKPFKGPIVPFGSLVKYHPISAKDQSTDTLCTRGEFGRVADFEELETMDGSEIYSKDSMELIFPVRRWTNQTSWRRSGPENIHHDTASSNSRRNLLRHWTEIGWFACSGTMGSNCFCSWKYFSFQIDRSNLSMMFTNITCLMRKPM